MAAEIIFRPVVKNELDEIVSYYESNKEGLGILFLDTLDILIQRIQNSPLQFPIVHQKICRAVMIDFPYSVYFRLHKKQIIILAITHQKRNPKIWKKRK